MVAFFQILQVYCNIEMNENIEKKIVNIRKNVLSKRMNQMQLKIVKTKRCLSVFEILIKIYLEYISSDERDMFIKMAFP